MWLDYLEYAITAILLTPTAVVCAECLAALFGRVRPASASVRPDDAGDIAVLVPAHDEQEGLAATLSNIQAQLRPGDRLIVIADNCTDFTASVAASSGAEVVERDDPLLRGKGYALDAGIARLRHDPPNYVIMIDADCSLFEGALDALVAQAYRTAKPAQAVYLMRSADTSGRVAPRDAISVFAFLVKNWVRPLGLRRLGMPCLLTGTGMIFSWSTISSITLASGNIVEDMQLSLDLAIAGHAPLLCESANVTATLPDSDRAADTQRRRWEHGHLRTLFTQLPRLLWHSARHLDPRLAILALEVGVPPLSLLVMLMLLVLAGAIAFGFSTHHWAPAIALASGIIALTVVIALAWLRFARPIIPGRSLLLAPIYAFSKANIYVSFVSKPQRKWVRTPRPAVVSNKPNP